MHFVGVDLAWGERQAHRAGRPRRRGPPAARLGACAPTTRSSPRWRRTSRATCLVGIDAPLIVTNPTGNRPGRGGAEQGLRAASTPARTRPTPASRSSPRPRAAPGSARGSASTWTRGRGRARRAIEVYPHPATVALFRLGRTLKYKNKPGRGLRDAARRAADADAAGRGAGRGRARRCWSTGRRRAGRGWSRRSRTATRKSELRVVEDQVDAVVCAYVALLRRAPARADHDVRRRRDGYIVTPTLPGRPRPTPDASRRSWSPRAGDPCAQPSRSTPPQQAAVVDGRGRRSSRWSRRSSTRPASTT